MAAVTRNPLLPFARHLRADANVYVQHLRKGQSVRSGSGLAFWFRPRTAALTEVPLDDREQALFFHARTADFQDVTVQATVSFRVLDPELATSRIDFGINPQTGIWNGTPLEILGGLLTELAQQPAVEKLAQMSMREALAVGIVPVRNGIADALRDDTRLAERGIAVTDVRVVAVRTDPEVERSMQTDTREQIQQEADRATYERRAMAVERERSIAENELKNQIELARREEELVGQRGQNERKRATELAAAEAIATGAKAERRGLLAETEAAATRMLGAAEAEAETARYGAYQGVETTVILGLAVQELAKNLPNIDSLTITPDLLTSAIAQFAGGSGSSRVAIDTP